MMELAVNSAFHNRPKPFNGVGMDCAVLSAKQVTAAVPVLVANCSVNDMVIHPIVAGVFIRVQNAVRHIQHFPCDFEHIGNGHFVFVNGLCFDFSATLNGSNYGNLLCAASAFRALPIIVLTPFTGLAAYVGFVHFNDTRQQSPIVHHGLADAVHHAPYGRAAHFQIPRCLHGRQPFLGRKHKGDKQEPSLQINVAVVENRPHGHGKRFAAKATLPTVTLFFFSLATDLFAHAVRATRRFAPTHLFKMVKTVLFRGKTAINAYNACHYTRSSQKMPHSKFIFFMGLPFAFGSNSSRKIRSPLTRTNLAPMSRDCLARSSKTAGCILRTWFQYVGEVAFTQPMQLALGYPNLYISGNSMPASLTIWKHCSFVMPSSIKTGIRLLLSPRIKLSLRFFSSSVKPNTCQSAWLFSSHCFRAIFFNSSVHGAPSGPDMKRRFSQTSTQAHDGYLSLVANSTGTPNHASTSRKKRKLSGCSSFTGLFTTMIFAILPYFSMVFFAATALAAPHENQTAIVSPFLIIINLFCWCLYYQLTKTTYSCQALKRTIPDFFINGKERLSALGTQKRHYANIVQELKREIGINRKFQRNQNVPKHIRMHPKFRVLLDVMEKLTDIEAQITELKNKAKGLGSFQERFVALMKERHPGIYEKIKAEVLGYED